MCISIVSFSDTEAESEKRILDKLRGITYHKRVLYICVYVYIYVGPAGGNYYLSEV